MLVTERMQALGDHARSSRQPPVKERKYAKADKSAAEQVAADEAMENGSAHESAAAVIVHDAAPQTVLDENGNGAAAEITSDEEAAVLATVTAMLAKLEPQPATADDNATQQEAAQEDGDLSAAKRAIIHEWENWSALHSDELGDPNVSDYFFNHLQAKKPELLNFSSQDKQEMVRRALRDLR